MTDSVHTPDRMAKSVRTPDSPLGRYRRPVGRLDRVMNNNTTSVWSGHDARQKCGPARRSIHRRIYQGGLSDTTGAVYDRC